MVEDLTRRIKTVKELVSATHFYFAACSMHGNVDRSTTLVLTDLSQHFYTMTFYVDIYGSERTLYILVTFSLAICDRIVK